MDIGTLPSRNARHYPDREALVFESTRLTWRELNGRINRVANALHTLGITKGDKVALLLPNSLELVELYWAIAKVGAVAVPLSPLLRGAALVTLVCDSDAVALITAPELSAAVDVVRDQLVAISASRLLVSGGAEVDGFADYAALVAGASDAEPPASGVGESDPYNIMYSSGTTGEPKGIVHTHGLRAHFGMVFSTPFGFHSNAVVMQSGSLVFNGAMLMFLPWMYNAATLVLQRKFDAGVYLKTLVAERGTHSMLVPSQLVALLAHPDFTPDALSSMETVLSVGAPLLLEHKVRLSRMKPGIWCELYGLTEGGCATILDRNDFIRKSASVGTPMPFCRMKIIDDDGHELPTGGVGEIVGSGLLQMAGYYKRPDLTANVIRDGWLHTGDVGYFDTEGFLHLVDRKKDMIISGGINVYPKDIEEIAAQHPAVREAAVFGVPDDRWGEVAHCAVIVREGHDVTADTLKSWINERVTARYQRVSDVSLVTDFPRNVAGKTLKREMRAPFWATRGTAI